MRHGSLFSGIGGFDLAAEWMGWTNVFHCEWNEFGQKVLKYYWPNAISYGDITKTDFTIWRGRIDILTGGFPCQPFSMAGKRKGTEDERHLWPEMLRTIREIKPTWVVGENVFGITNWDGGVVFNEVQADLEAEGYEVQPYVLPACAVNAPHRRDRVWFVAHSTSIDARGTGGLPNNRNEGYQKKNGERLWDKLECNGSIQPSSDTLNPRTGERLRTNGNGEEKDERRAEQSQSELRENGGSSPDTEGNSGTGQLNQGQWKGQFRGCDSQIIADTCNKGLERGEINRSIGGIGTERDKQFARCFRPNWQNFPTVSPLCGGDDGLPDNLVGITFPKWRNESIKAMGNAIVPQVALQIFKAIEQYERLNP